MLLTFILTSIPSYLFVFHHPHFFIPGLKPYFSANPSDRSLPFFFGTDHMDFPDCLLYSRAYPLLLFSFSVLHFLVVVSVR